MKLLKSARFQVVLAALVAYLVVFLAKKYFALELNTNEVATILLALGGMLIGGYTLRDAGAAVANGPQTLKDSITEAFMDVLDEYYAELQPEDDEAK